MSDPMWSGRSASPSYGSRPPPARESGGSLGDILERVLDRGVVIVGDIRVNLLDIELLTIKLRLLIASVDTARELGIDWWEHDPWLSSKDRDLIEENRMLRRRLAAVRDEEEAGLPAGERDRAAAGRGARRTGQETGPASRSRDDRVAYPHDPPARGRARLETQADDDLSSPRDRTARAGRDPAYDDAPAPRGRPVREGRDPVHDDAPRDRTARERRDPAYDDAPSRRERPRRDGPPGRGRREERDE